MDRDAAAPDGRLMPLLRRALTCLLPTPKSDDRKTLGMALRRGADRNQA
jgi:hypothetical protein